MELVWSTVHIGSIWLLGQANFMSHVQLLLNMVSAHKDDLELWAVDEIKTGTVARITKLASDAYIQQHNNQQEAEKQKTTHVGKHNALNEDQALKMTAGNVCFIEFF